MNEAGTAIGDADAGLNKRAARLREDHDSGQYTSSEIAEIAEIAELYGISRTTVYRTINRMPAPHHKQA